MVFLSFINIILIFNSQAQPILDSQVGSASTAIASSENNAVKILGIDPVAFPKIKVNIFIDKFCAMAGNLKKETFKINEDGHDAKQ